MENDKLVTEDNRAADITIGAYRDTETGPTPGNPDLCAVAYCS